MRQAGPGNDEMRRIGVGDGQADAPRSQCRIDIDGFALSVALHLFVKRHTGGNRFPGQLVGRRRPLTTCASPSSSQAATRISPRSSRNWTRRNIKPPIFRKILCGTHSGSLNISPATELLFALLI